MMTYKCCFLYFSTCVNHHLLYSVVLKQVNLDLCSQQEVSLWENSVRADIFM